MMIRLLLLVLVFFAGPAFAADTIDARAFGQLPIQHEGRFKPVDSVARSFLKSISGRDSVEGRSADQWFAEILFDPASAIDRPVFRILNPHNIGLPVKDSKYYSYAEIFEFLSGRRETIDRLASIPPKDWSDDQKQLMMLSEQSILYTQFLRSMAYLIPIEVEVPPALGKEWKLPKDFKASLQTILPYEAKLKSKAAQIVKRRGSNPDKYSDSEKQIAAFAFFVETIKTNGVNNFAFRVVPPKEGEEWLSPWVALQSEDTGSEILSLWSNLALQYRAADAKAFDDSVNDLSKAYASHIDAEKIKAETFYNAAHPIGLSMFGYLFSFLAFSAYALSNKKPLWMAAFGFLGAAAAIHVVAIALRVYILERPPVGTLYESVLFVAAIVAIGALIFESRRKDGIGILSGSISAAFLLFISEAFAGEDTMHMLVAVLNTNFWLATHVLCITIGYGLCLMTSALAHIHLATSALTSARSNLMPSIKTTGLMALLFTAVGTILGGIWADQSWGRFWGWDPKENGALLIVLWLAWAYHGHLSGHLKNTAFAAMMATLSIIVGLAWFGVNLLNVGLHSYGFITGVAASLFAFCAVEIALISYLWRRIEKTVQV